MNLEKIRKILPSRIRTFRNSMSMTQERLAEKVNIHATYISRIESGKKLPTLIIVCKIADVFEIDIYELLIDEVEANSYDHKRRKLTAILNESRPSDIDMYYTLLDTLHKKYKKRKR